MLSLLSDMNHFQQATVEIYQSKYKLWFMVEKKGEVGASSKSLDKENEILSSSKEGLGPRNDRGHSEGCDTHVLQSTSSKDKSLVEKPKNFVRGPEERVGSKEGQQPSGSSSSLQKQEYASKHSK
ncbi:hypothetical protein O181_033532 [Austropuccinia psidii MF-1]|uniref:Uncharacterized protein n=1 Tax=Austropuccinia psidii MF-1 TaxID=1389203 RepID=A0A9Q3D4T3_9BASI|nr:hypothetical protein [Austropuccinia psidii MF-1]